MSRRHSDAVDFVYFEKPLDTISKILFCLEVMAIYEVSFWKKVLYNGGISEKLRLLHVDAKTIK